ncbi:NAD(P)-binding protein [Bimuria novae-zelandiae CBS 107.79]|uniref:NAD(P)-binding protein n=1 Tax=Bimuria novae-zelandiae CBS 107.79 TaxID=1447943 RepID=A0A6A5US52_9PLEO|nr:NAD(P)-binding protein [Bimuria novae-zelandiae CBS 107.79]
MSEQDLWLGNALVFGGCGFLGHHIAKQLSTASDVAKVFVFDKKTSKNCISGVEYITGDITSKDDVDEAFKCVQPKVVFNTVFPNPFLNDNKVFHSVNVDGTKNIIAAARKNNCTMALVYTSSSSVIHDNPIAETLTLDANGKDIRTAAIRPAGLFGEGDTETVTSVISNAREGKARMQIGDNSNLFDWTYVGNNAYARKRACGCEAFQITNDEPWHFSTFTRALAAAGRYPVPAFKVVKVVKVPWSVMMGVLSFGSKKPRLTRARVKYVTMERTLDITKAKTRLGYRP